MPPEPHRPNPFVGPVPFERKDAALFFGRSGEIQELVSQIVANRVVVLYAASGAGKTSLLNAGVLPLLEQRERFEVLPIARFARLGADDGRSIANVYVHTALATWSEAEEAPSLHGESAAEHDTRSAVSNVTGETTLQGFLSATPKAHDARGRRLSRLVVFDQFEEIFTVHPEYWEHREGFFVQLAAALFDDPHLRVLIALREDYLAQLEPLLLLLPSHTRYRLERLGRDGAIDAVTGPVERAGLRFGAGVVEAVVENLQMLRSDAGGSEPIEVPGEFVEPVQLQVVCHSLWDELPPDVGVITEQHVDAFGGVDEVLQRFYDGAAKAAAKAARVREGRLRRWVEESFITSVQTRNTIYRAIDSKARFPNAAIDELEDRHVIRGEWRAGTRWYELTHDRFIRPIQMSNARASEQRSRRRRRWAGAGGATVLASFVAAWTLAAVREESIEPSASVSIRGDPALNVPFASYQEVVGLRQSGSAAERARLGNLVNVHVTTEGFVGQFLVVEATTVDARGNRLPAHRIEFAFGPRTQTDQSLQQIWIPLPARPGRYAYTISLSTEAGVELNRVRSTFFTVGPQGKSREARRAFALLRVRRTGGGSGTVVSAPAGIDCDASCAADYTKGTAVSLLATPAPRSVFRGWSGRCGSKRACSVTVDAATVVAALFVRVRRGFTYDFISTPSDRGVLNRRAPRLDADLPGLGPLEGVRVEVLCYVRGERVEGNRYWAKIAAAPDRYVPATYLRHGFVKPPPGLPVC